MLRRGYLLCKSQRKRGSLRLRRGPGEQGGRYTHNILKGLVSVRPLTMYSASVDVPTGTTLDDLNAPQMRGLSDS